ncbi:MFS transporter [Parabacteroides pacaensis]|uniref:MFS transporter n=1 Tax=Parabacteroides pacaensis TaxID=2086575 RepID=UPI000D0EB4C3|nr:MFS transporter [Parabacteroides pacaensis]
MRTYTLRDSATKRWLVMLAVSFTMLTGYFVADVMAPLQTLLENELTWNSEEYGFFTSAYGWFNVFLFMLIIGGIILDKMGVRFTGLMAASLMVVGAVIKYGAISSDLTPDLLLFGRKMSVMLACLGYATFCVGLEIFGITASKVIVKWFKGKELALALGLQIAVARIGTTLAFAVSVPVAKMFGTVAAPMMLGCIGLLAGLVMYIYYSVLDTKLEKQIQQEEINEPSDAFKLSDLGQLLSNKMFWIICTLCLTFYAGVFPYLKFATSFMIEKFGVTDDFAGTIPSLLPLGTLFMTPLFGTFIDRKGYALKLMILGSVMLLIIHLLFAVPSLNQSIVAVGLTILMGVAFSLVPAAMWPTLARIIPENQLGSAYAFTFWLQNIGLMGVPYLIGWELNKYGETVIDGTKHYDYTIPMLTFAAVSLVAVFLAVLLNVENTRKGYNLNSPNMKE